MERVKYFLAKVYWFVFRPKTYGVKCVIKYGDEILMIKNSYGPWNNWMLPGGGIGKGETTEDAVKREIKEEVSITGINFRKIGEYNSQKEYKRDTVTVFVCETKNREFKIDSKEISEARWFNVYNLPEVSEYSKNIFLMLK